MNTTQQNVVRTGLIAIGLLAALAALPTFAQSNIPCEETWITNGPVGAIATTPSTTYIGGNFNYVGPYTGNGVPIDATTGKPVGQFPKVSGSVVACVSDGADGWYIGGDFTQVGTVKRNRIAHLLSNGTVDLAWDPNANGGGGTSTVGRVEALVVSGTTVYVGGYFTEIGGQPRNHIAALDAITGTATDWNPNINSSSVDCSVYALAVSGTTIYAGGRFSNIGGQMRSYVAALDATTGLATDWNPNANSSVYALVISGTTIYVGGNFSTIGGQIRNHIAALDVSTGSPTAWNPGANGSLVLALALSGTTIYAGGDFTTIGGQARNCIAALNTDTGLATDWNPWATGMQRSGINFTYVRTLGVSGTTIYAGGNFSKIGLQLRNSVAALDAKTGTATDWNPNASDVVNILALSGTTVYVGGVLSSVGGEIRHGIAALDNATGTLIDWNPIADMPVNTLAVSDDATTVYAGGEFTDIGSQTRNFIAALNAATGLATAWNPNADSRVTTLAVSGTTVYAGGAFTSIGGQTRNYIAALDATTGNATDWNPNAGGTSNPYVCALALSGTTVYAGGLFSTIGGQARNLIAALNAETGLATDWNPNAINAIYTNPSVGVLALSGDGTSIYACGNFTSIGGQVQNYIAALDATTGLTTDWNPNVDGMVWALAVSGTTVYAGGTFTSIGGQTRNSIAALDAITGTATDWNPNINSSSVDCSVYALAVSGTTIYAGGSFATIGGQPQYFFAQFDGVAGEGEGEGEGASELLLSYLLVHGDGNGDGSVSFADAQGVIPGLTSADYALLDINQDGVLSATDLSGSDELLIDYLFAHADVNGDSLVSLSEAQTVIPGLLSAEFNLLDTNADGSLSSTDVPGEGEGEGEGESEGEGEGEGEGETTWGCFSCPGKKEILGWSCGS